MTLDSPSTDLINKLSSGRELDLHVLEDDIERIELDSQGVTGEVFYGCKRPSIYVDAFERMSRVIFIEIQSERLNPHQEMINTVHEHESHLLSEDEWLIFSRYAHLSCVSSLSLNVDRRPEIILDHARYCLVRLVLRKCDKWHTVLKMEKFKKEVGEEGLVCALDDLCQPLSGVVKAEPMDADLPIKEEGPEVIDLTCDFEDEGGLDDHLPIPVEPHLEVPTLDDILSDPNSTNFDTLKLDYFCEDEGAMSLSEILWTLKLEDLKDLVKTMKVKPLNSTVCKPTYGCLFTKLTCFQKPWIIRSLLHHASTQTVLDYDHVPSPKSKKKKKGKDDGLRQTTLSFFMHRKPKSVPETQEKRLREMALMALGTSRRSSEAGLHLTSSLPGKCVRVNPDFHKLIVRVNIIYDRANDYPKGLLLPAILTTLKIRVYPEYTYSRDGTIWCTRDEILRYVEALHLDTVIEQELEPSKTKVVPKTPLPQDRTKHATPATGGPSSRTLTTPLKTPGVRWATATPVAVKEEAAFEANLLYGEECVVEDSVKDQKAKRVKRFFENMLFPKWKNLVAIKQDQEYLKRTPGLERFEPG